MRDFLAVFLMASVVRASEGFPIVRPFAFNTPVLERAYSPTYIDFRRYPGAATVVDDIEFEVNHIVSPIDDFQIRENEMWSFGGHELLPHQDSNDAVNQDQNKRQAIQYLGIGQTVPIPKLPEWRVWIANAVIAVGFLLLLWGGFIGSWWGVVPFCLGLFLMFFGFSD